MQRHAGPPAEDLPSPEPTPEVVAASRRQVETLRLAILELPPRCREVFLLHKGQGKRYSAIAAELGISIRTVEHHLARAMLHCRQRLKVAVHHIEAPGTRP
jgi:RNA polymerase sigma-70 factor (ECF subfamily)